LLTGWYWSKMAKNGPKIIFSFSQKLSKKLMRLKLPKRDEGSPKIGR